MHLGHRSTYALIELLNADSCPVSIVVTDQASKLRPLSGAELKETVEYVGNIDIVAHLLKSPHVLHLVGFMSCGLTPHVAHAH